MKPLAIDLYCGLGGWTEGFLAEGYRCIGFDVERHDYGTGGYPGQLVLQDVTTLHGSQFRDAACIVASPPCQEYSYRAMPWKRAKALPPPDNTLFEACFRIQQEASAAAGHRIPLVIENVKGAQRWVGRARWHFGSYYLWGDVPALMPICLSSAKVAGQNWSHFRKRGEVSPHWRLMGLKTVAHINQRNGHSHTRHLTDPREACGIKQIGSGAVWFDTGIARLPSNCDERRRAAALIAKIPLTLARWVARCYMPQEALSL